MRGNTSSKFEQLEPRQLFAVAPNDPLYPLQTWLPQISVPQAWEITTGSSAAVVNVNDGGIDYTHPDLYLNIWLNQQEIPLAIGGNKGLRDTDADGLITFWDLNARGSNGKLVNGAFVGDLNANGYIDGGDLLNDPRWENGTDDGGNGYVDDLIGWNFESGNNDPMDDDGHGSMCAGIIGMVTDNAEGAAGVAWRVGLMATKLYSANTLPLRSDIGAGVRYAVDNGARISNNSLVDEPDKKIDPIYYAAFDYARSKDVLAVVCAGNQSWDNDVKGKDQNSIANVDLPNVMSVAAVTSDDQLASFSNYGLTSVDLAAPGVDIGSTFPVALADDAPYRLWSGTQVAVPHVAGAAALLLARNPDLSYAQLKDLILSNVDPVPALAGKTVTGGRLNVFKALSAVPSPGGGGGGGGGVATPSTSPFSTASANTASAFDSLDGEEDELAVL